MNDLTCLHCGKPRTARARYCSAACRSAAWRTRKRRDSGLPYVDNPETVADKARQARSVLDFFRTLAPVVLS